MKLQSHTERLLKQWHSSFIQGLGEKQAFGFATTNSALSSLGLKDHQKALLVAKAYLAQVIATACGQELNSNFTVEQVTKKFNLAESLNSVNSSENWLCTFSMDWLTNLDCQQAMPSWGIIAKAVYKGKLSNCVFEIDRYLSIMADIALRLPITDRPTNSPIAHEFVLDELCLAMSDYGKVEQAHINALQQYKTTTLQALLDVGNENDLSFYPDYMICLADMIEKQFLTTQ